MEIAAHNTESNMEQKHHFIITRYCPMEQLFDGMMTFTEARKFMDEHASFERRVGFKVFNELYNNGSGRWEDFKDSYHGGRKVYDNKGYLYILDPDHRGMWKPEDQAWHLWFVRNDGTRMFIQSFKSEEQANKRRDYLTADWKEGTYIVEPSDIKIEEL